MLLKEKIYRLFRVIAPRLTYARPKKVMFYDQEPTEIQPFINTKMAEKNPRFRVVYIRAM